MPVAQWAPWVAVFLGGCLSGAALLSLGTNPAPVAWVVPAERATEGVEPGDPAEPAETEHDAAPLTGDVIPTSDADQRALAPVAQSPAESEHDAAAPSAADILAELESAYQRQLADAGSGSHTAPSDAPPPSSEPSVPAAAPPVTESAGSREVTVASLREQEPSPRAAEVHEERLAVHAAGPGDASPTGEPTPSADDGERHEREVASTQIQQVAVLYQPVVVVSGTSSAPPSSATPRTPRIGLDPWAPTQMSPRHNPWAITPPRGGAWGTIGPQGGAWGVSFGHRP